MGLLQMLEQGLCLHTRLQGELLPNLLPNIRERIPSHRVRIPGHVNNRSGVM
jgi:hypothetical protein